MTDRPVMRLTARALDAVARRTSITELLDAAVDVLARSVTRRRGELAQRRAGPGSR
jgi:hypothetical protein